MAFETPIDNVDAATALRSLDYQAIQIARNPERLKKLHDFFTSFVLPQVIEHECSDGVVRQYTWARVAAVGSSGSLVAIRETQEVSWQTGDLAMSDIAIISHLDDPSEPTISHVITRDRNDYGAAPDTEYTVLSQPEFDGLQLVDDSMSPREWAIEQAILREASLEARPIIRIAPTTWEYRRSDGLWEKLEGMHAVCDRVSIASFRKLGHTATAEESGQLEQKVLG